MANVHQIITQGIGTPGGIAHFLLLGLSLSQVDVIATPWQVNTGGVLASIDVNTGGVRDSTDVNTAGISVGS